MQPQLKPAKSSRKSQNACRAKVQIPDQEQPTSAAGTALSRQSGFNQRSVHSCSLPELCHKRMRLTCCLPSRDLKAHSLNHEFEVRFGAIWEWQTWLSKSYSHAGHWTINCYWSSYLERRQLQLLFLSFLLISSKRAFYWRLPARPARPARPTSITVTLSSRNRGLQLLAITIQSK